MNWLRMLHETDVSGILAVRNSISHNFNVVPNNANIVFQLWVFWDEMAAHATWNGCPRRQGYQRYSCNNQPYEFRFLLEKYSTSYEMGVMGILAVRNDTHSISILKKYSAMYSISVVSENIDIF